jgi:DNA-binding PadR family transcriptional regulator
MDMMEALKTASVKIDNTNRFDARQAFGKRVGKHMIFPVGLGSALAKAVREGYLLVVGEGSRRRGRTYEFTEKGRRELA